MKKRQPIEIPPELNARLTEYRKRGVELACESGLFEVQDRFAEIVEPQLHALACELLGPLGVDPTVLEERESAFRKRSQDATLRVDEFFEKVRTAPWLAGSVSSQVFGWRGCLTAVVLAALVGLSWPGLTWRGSAILTLVTVLSLLVLPVAPVLVRTGLAGLRCLTSCLRDAFASEWASRNCRRLESQRWAEADHRASVDHWVAGQMSHMLAEYEYHKGLASRARLAA